MIGKEEFLHRNFGLLYYKYLHMIHIFNQVSKEIKTKVCCICFHDSFILQQLKSVPIKFCDFYIYQLPGSQVMWVPGYKKRIEMARPIFRH